MPILTKVWSFNAPNFDIKNLDKLIMQVPVQILHRKIQTLNFD